MALLSFRDEKLWKLSKRIVVRGGGERDEKPWDRNEKREKKRAPAVWVNQ